MDVSDLDFERFIESLNDIQLTDNIQLNLTTEDIFFLGFSPSLLIEKLQTIESSKAKLTEDMTRIIKYTIVRGTFTDKRKKTASNRLAHWMSWAYAKYGICANLSGQSNRRLTVTPSRLMDCFPHLVWEVCAQNGNLYKMNRSDKAAEFRQIPNDLRCPRLAPLICHVTDTEKKDALKKLAIAISRLDLSVNPRRSFRPEQAIENAIADSSVLADVSDDLKEKIRNSLESYPAAEIDAYAESITV